MVGEQKSMDRVVVVIAKQRADTLSELGRAWHVKREDGCSVVPENCLIVVEAREVASTGHAASSGSMRAMNMSDEVGVLPRGVNSEMCQELATRVTILVLSAELNNRHDHLEAGNELEADAPRRDH